MILKTNDFITPFKWEVTLPREIVEFKYQCIASAFYWNTNFALYENQATIEGCHQYYELVARFNQWST